MTEHVLVIEADPQLRRLLEFLLSRAGFGVVSAGSVAATRAQLDADLPAAVVVALELPDGDGLEVCRRLQAAHGGASIPVIVMGGDASSGRKCECFERGAWDYLGKPLDCAELVWRLRAHLHAARSGGTAGELVQAGDMRLDARNHTVSLGGELVLLTPNECAILRKLLEAPGRAFDVETLLVDALGYPPRLGNPEIVRTHVRNLRQKLEVDPREPRLIVNLPRIGYAVRVSAAAG